MRGMIAIVATGAMLVVASAASAQDARPTPAYAFFTPPIGNVDSFVDNTFEASFVSTGTAPVKLTIQLCTLAGVCTSPGFVCVGVPLTRGTGCSTGPGGRRATLCQVPRSGDRWRDRGRHGLAAGHRAGRHQLGGRPDAHERSGPGGHRAVMRSAASRVGRDHPTGRIL